MFFSCVDLGKRKKERKREYFCCWRECVSKGRRRDNRHKFHASTKKHNNTQQSQSQGWGVEQQKENKRKKEKKEKKERN